MEGGGLLYPIWDIDSVFRAQFPCDFNSKCKSAQCPPLGVSQRCKYGSTTSKTSLVYWKNSHWPASG